MVGGEREKRNLYGDYRRVCVVVCRGVLVKVERNTLRHETRQRVESQSGCVGANDMWLGVFLGPCSSSVLHHQPLLPWCTRDQDLREATAADFTMDLLRHSRR